MFVKGKIWPYMAMFAAIIIGAETLSGWHGISVMVLVLVIIVGLIDFVWTAARQRR
jgi:ABC-type xylose transport system permease subunit